MTKTSVSPFQSVLMTSCQRVLGITSFLDCAHSLVFQKQHIFSDTGHASLLRWIDVTSERGGGRVVQMSLQYFFYLRVDFLATEFKRGK